MRKRVVFAIALGIAMGLGIGAAFAGTPSHFVAGAAVVSLLGTASG